ncbi:MarR family winged helix-turn-helix transcriptional regulator [Micromonospora sp. DT233]|uniref:MarR family winged helix-turn-helix transcriptional regulator n=1 Tax=Micromonospora sp. DT233 TaxID=3393432 RepID=UPI003CF80F8C
MTADDHAPGPPQQVGADEESLAESFWAVTRRLRHLSRQTLEPWEINPGQARALGVLVRHGAMRLSALAEHLRIAPRSATEVVDGLAERGLVARHPDPVDRRATLVAPTDEGLRVGAAIRAARHAEAERLFGGLDPTDRVHLARILRTLRD